MGLTMKSGDKENSERVCLCSIKFIMCKAYPFEISFYNVNIIYSHPVHKYITISISAFLNLWLYTTLSLVQYFWITGSLTIKLFL